MPNTSDRLIGVRAKIGRAKQHIRDLDVVLSVFRQSNDNGLRVECDSQTGDRVFRVQLTQTPDEIPFIIGDAVHNLRSALDHLVCQFALKAGVTAANLRSYSFPVFKDVPKDKTALHKQIRGIDTIAASLIESLQPYHGRNEDIWTLTELDNFDKHRLVIVAVRRVREVALIVNSAGIASMARQLVAGGIGRTQFQYPPDNESATGIGSYRILQNGDEFCRALAGDGNEQHTDVKLTFEIAFHEPAVVKGRPVLATLTNLTQLVEGIVNQFVPLL